MAHSTSTFLTRSLWILPFISFLCGYQMISWFYGVDTFATPAVVGKNLHEAVTLLSGHNLNPRIISHKEDAELPAGTVVSQRPLADSKIKPNQSVFLITSIKPSSLNAPLLTYKSVKTITHETHSAGIRIKYYTLNANHPKDHCIAQFPQAGTMLEERKMIVYIAAGNQKPLLLPDFKGKPVSLVTEFLAAYPCTPAITHTEQRTGNHQCLECIVTDQRPLPGSLITFDEKKPLPIQLQVN